MKIISFVIPCYNEELNVNRIYQAILNISKKLQNYSFEIVIVDNGSQDQTRQKIKSIIRYDKRVKGIFLSRNFGPEASVQAGYNFVTGDAVIGIAADFQDPPELIPKFIKKWEEGYPAVVGTYGKIDDYFPVVILRKLFYKVLKRISSIDVPVNTSGYGLMDRRVLEAMRSLPEKNRFFRGLRAWVGFKTAFIRYERPQRKYGKSSYTIIDYFKHAERGLFGFSYLLLDFIVYIGFATVILSFISLILLLSAHFIFSVLISQSFAIILVVILVGGIQLLAISIIGKYIQVIVEETKNRPPYIVEETLNVRKK